MKIYRDGKEFELTQQELRMAYEEKHMAYLKEDVESMTEDGDAFDDSDIEIIAERFELELEHNDGYWDRYWETMEYVIENYIREGKE